MAYSRIFLDILNYIFVNKRFATSINRNKTRSFPGDDIRSDQDMVMITLNLRLKIRSK